MRPTKKLSIVLALAGLLSVAGWCLVVLGRPSMVQSAPTLKVRVVGDFPHDASAFCQGLVIDEGVFFESTGQYQRSTLRKIDLDSGRILAYQKLSPNYFGEGITVVGDRIYQITWKERVCVVYDKTTLRPLGVFNYAGEGWGLTDDGKHLFMSDGTSSIRVLDPMNFKVLRKLRVKDGRRNVTKLNELEFFDDHIWANVWYEDRIAKIDPQSGKVVAWLDCSSVYPAHTRPDREHVLNGIAYDPDSGRIFITGKNWPRIYEIEIVEEN